MAIYAIGDVQGCYKSLKNLLKEINYHPSSDILWFTGDLVNRGPASLDVVKFVMDLGDRAQTVLGNHDLHLLMRARNLVTPHRDDTLDEILSSTYLEEILLWLRHRPFIKIWEDKNWVLVHAGIYPYWTIKKSGALALEVEEILKSDSYMNLLTHLYGNKPEIWDENLTGTDRLRFITNVFTRMRFCDLTGRLNLKVKGTLASAPTQLVPWFNFPRKEIVKYKILFGHWAALREDWPNLSKQKNIYPLDGGCVWGGYLCAIRLEDEKRFEIKG